MTTTIIDITPPEIVGVNISEGQIIEPGTTKELRIAWKENVARTWVEIDIGGEGSIDETLEFAFYQQLIYGYTYRENWAVPNVPRPVTLFWRATDDAGNINTKWETNAEIAELPTGGFWVKDGNDPEYIAGGEGEYVFNHHRLDFKFVATSRPGAITKISVWIHEGSGQVKHTYFIDEFGLAGSTWTWSWTAPEDGVYTLTLAAHCPGQVISSLCATAAIGVELPLPFPSGTMLVIIAGLAMTAFGGILWAKARGGR